MKTEELPVRETVLLSYEKLCQVMADRPKGFRYKRHDGRLGFVLPTPDEREAIFYAIDRSRPEVSALVSDTRSGS